jgi:hypothetical protein
MKENPLELFIESMVKELGPDNILLEQYINETLERLGPDKLLQLIDLYEQLHKKRETEDKR